MWKNCTQINPLLFEKETTIEDIHEDLTRKKSLVKEADLSFNHSIQKSEEQYSLEFEPDTESLEMKKDLSRDEKDTLLFSNTTDSPIKTKEKIIHEYYNLLQNRHRRKFNPPKPSKIKDVCAGTKTTKFNEINREITLKTLKRTNKKSYYALLKNEFRSAIKKIKRSRQTRRQRTKDLRTKTTYAGSIKKIQKNKSRSESVEKLIEDHTRNQYDHLYQPRFDNIPLDQIQLPYINYETANLEARPEFRRTQKLKENHSEKKNHNHSTGIMRLREGNSPYKRTKNKNSTLMPTHTQYIFDPSSPSKNIMGKKKHDMSSIHTLKTVSSNLISEDKSRTKRMRLKNSLSKKGSQGSINILIGNPIAGRSYSLMNKRQTSIGAKGDRRKKPKNLRAFAVRL